MNAEAQQQCVLPYSPRQEFRPFHERTQRFSELICHRRAGKTVAAVNDLLMHSLGLQLPPSQRVNPPRFAYMAPTRVRGKDIAWQYLKRFSEAIPGRRVSESELYVEDPRGGRVTIYGADNDRGMGLYIDGIVLDECDEIPPAVDDVVIPALADRGGWMVHMGILRGRHNLFKRYQKFRGDPNHFQLFLRASETGILSADELALQKSMIGEAAFNMQFEGDASAALANAIYGDDMERARRDGRLRQLAADRGVPLYTFWDIGYSDYTVLWLVQFVGRDILLLDYFCRSGQPASFYAAKVREWEQAHGQPVRCSYVPHDANSHDKGSGKTYVDHLKEAGLTSVKVVPRTPDLWQGINVLRKLFPRIYIDSVKCSNNWTQGEMEMPSGVDCLDYYSKKQDATSGFVKDEPVHDQYSHGASALRTLAEAHDRGLLEGVSFTATETKRDSVKVLRGPGAQSYSLSSPRHAWRGKVLR